MCQLANAEMAIERFRDGHLPHLRAARVRVTRILEKNARKQVRGAFFLLLRSVVLVIMCGMSDVLFCAR